MQCVLHNDAALSIKRVNIFQTLCNYMKAETAPRQVEH